MESGDDEMDALMIKRPSGTLSAAEETRLEALLKGSDQTRKNFDHYEKLWNASGSLSLRQGHSRDHRWNKLKEKISNDDSKESRWPFKVMLRYAAVLAGI